MEPGSAFAWQTGFLLTTVVDIVENHGIKTAIIDASFTCHMPDCLEMPYKPAIRFATDAVEGKPTYRIGGNSCLSGDYMGGLVVRQAFGDRRQADFRGYDPLHDRENEYVQRHPASFLSPLEQGRPAGDVPYVRL